jgi:hypothetical protein
MQLALKVPSIMRSQPQVNDKSRSVFEVLGAHAASNRFGCVRSVALLLSSLVCGLAASDHVRASCAQPAPDVQWTYPADGDQDVPTDAVFWIVGTSWSEKVTLDGAALAGSSISFGAQHYIPSAMQPNTDHVLRIAFTAVSGAATDPKTVFEIAFHTSTGPGTAPLAPSAASYTTSAGFPTTHRCVKIISGQDCFDTGQNTLSTFSVTGDAIAWLVQSDYLGQSTVWPRDCGQPAVFGQGFASDDCPEISAIGRGGLVSPAVRACQSLPAADAGVVADEDGGTKVDAAVPAQPAANTPVFEEDAGSASAANVPRNTSAGSAGSRTASDADGGKPFDRAQAHCNASAHLGGEQPKPSSFAFALVLLALVRRRALGCAR